MTIKLQKRKILVSSFLFALGTAFYLNWQFSSKKIDVQNAMDVNSQKKTDENVKNVDSKEFLQENSDSGERRNYYENARKNRELAFKQSTQILQDAISDPNTNPKTKSMIEKEIVKSARDLKNEVNLENLIKAKGFDDAFVTFNENAKCPIVVPINIDSEDSLVKVKIITDLAESQNIKKDKVIVIPKSIDEK